MAKGKRGLKASGTALVQYRGPISAKIQMGSEVSRTTLKSTGPCNSNSAQFVEVYATTAGVTSNSEWSNIAPLWREYRVLGLRLEYQPAYDSGGYTGSQRLQGLGAMASYHGPAPAWQGAVTGSSTSNTWQMQGARPFHMGKVLVMEWRMNDVEEAQFFPTSTSTVVGGIYGTISGLTASTYYGSSYITWLVEFKGRV